MSFVSRPKSLIQDYWEIKDGPITNMFGMRQPLTGHQERWREGGGGCEKKQEREHFEEEEASKEQKNDRGG